MSASTDNPPPPRGPGSWSVLAALWQPAGLVYLTVLLAGLAAGLWPEGIYPTRSDVRAAPLPALRTLAMAQVAFFLVVYPLVALCRRRSAPGSMTWRRMLAETAGLFLTAGPFYLAAAFLADATWADAVRAAVYVASLCPLSWAASAWLGRGRGGAGAVLLFLLVVAAGLPAGWYVAMEFLPAMGRADWLARLAPATCAWQQAAARAFEAGPWYRRCLPTPAWAALIWPAVAAVGLCVQALLGRRR